MLHEVARLASALNWITHNNLIPVPNGLLNIGPKFFNRLTISTVIKKYGNYRFVAYNLVS